MSRKIVYLFLCIFALLFLSSCGTLGSSVSSRGEKTDNDYRIGTSGVRGSFVKDAPYSEYTPGSPFVVGIELHNSGAFSVDQGVGVIALSYDADYIELFSDNVKSFALEGKNKYNANGEERSYFYEGRVRGLDVGSVKRALPFIVNYCYPYKTVLEDTICIDSKFTDSNYVGEKPCDYQDLSYTGQGGPVSISRVTANVFVDQAGNSAVPTFDITIKHSGGGRVLDYENYRTACSGYSNGEADVMVNLELAKLSGIELDCGESKVSLINDETRIRCKATQNVYLSQLPFEAPLQLTLSYGYANSMKTMSSIVRLE